MSFSGKNDIDSGDVSAKLSSLTQAGDMLIAGAAPIMRVYHVKREERGYGCHVANVAQDVGERLSKLRRAATDVLIALRQGHENGTHKDFFARTSRVLDALVWLQLNDPYYQNIQIHDAALQALPVASQLSDLLEITDRLFLCTRGQTSRRTSVGGSDGGGRHIQILPTTNNR